MRRNLSFVIFVFLAALPATISVVHAQGAPGGAKVAGPVQVGVVTLHPQAVPITVDLPGRVVASQEADVRPQVGGIIKAIDFRAGAFVKAGDVLYEIDDAAYQAQVTVASAAVQKANAAVTGAQAKVTRDVQLGGNVAQSDLDDAKVALAQAQADAASATATLQSAQLNLDFAKVTAPISGLITESSVTVGALVTAAQTTALATIRLLDPVYVDLVETSTNLLKIRAQFQAGDLKGGPGKSGEANVHLVLDDGSSYPDAGKLTLADVVVSESTGTFTLQSTFPNAKRTLLPGMFVRATIDLGTNPSAFLVPQRAVTFDATGAATALFVSGGKAVARTLTTDDNIGNDWLVTKGISDGDQLIVDGLQKISNGSAVTPLEVTIDADGVVKQTIPAPAVPASGASSASPGN